MHYTTCTTDNYTYTTIRNSDVIKSLTLGDRTFDRVQILHALKAQNGYPYLEKDIDEIVNPIILARLDGAL